jgi:antibiotic biosynthesis monooxygenase (ABM) superfamily enzyme
MQHDGHALAADETDHQHHRPPEVASVHTRALVTWIAIFPLAAVGMALMARFAPGWPTLLRALALTAVVVPTTVYVTVPRLLALALLLSNRRRHRAAVRRTTAVRNTDTAHFSTPVGAAR